MAFDPSKTDGWLGYFVRHRTIANLMLVLMVALGFAAASQIRAQFFPDTVIETVAVSVTWEGAGPEDVDSAIVGALEPALLLVEGVASTESRTQEGSATITMEFEPGWDMARAADDVETAVDGVTGLPESAEDPVIRRGAWRDRVTDVVVTGPIGVEQLSRYADEFVARLFREGITRTTIRGIEAPSIRVSAPEAQLIRHDVTLAQISQAISEEAEADPAGDVGGGNARVRSGVEKRSAEAIGEVVIRANPDGSALRVSDVAFVEEETVDRGRAYFKGEDPAISIRVDRSDQGDAISIQRKVEEVAAEMQESLPPGVTLELIRTRAELINDRLNILLDNGLMGLALVVALLFLFLSARTAFWVAAGIPVAMLATLALMYSFGLTLNMVSLFALIICLGIVVDDAIVVGEHADFRHRMLGESPEMAATNAARRMSLPVLSATITTVIAFSALTVIEGRFGDLIADIPFTVSVVLLASLVECFLILPNHMKHALAAQDRGAPWYDAPSRVVNRGFRWVRSTLFRPFIGWVIQFRYPVLALTVLVLVQSVGLFQTGAVTWRFFNAPERGSVSGNIAMLPGATREDTMDMVRELQRATEAVAARFEEEHGLNPVTFAMAEVGGTTGRGLAGQDTKDPDQLGSIAIELIDADSRPYSSFTFVGALQDEVRSHPLLETFSFRGWRAGPGGDSLDVKFFGADAATLKGAAEALKTAVAEFPEVSAVEDNLAYDKTELVLDLTPQGSALGFSIDEIGTELRQRLNGIEAASFPDGLRSATVTVALPEAELTADFLDRTRLRTDTGAYVPLSEIVTVANREGFSTVRRENSLRVVTVTGDISEDDPVRAEAVTTALRETILPEIEGRFGVNSVLGGLAEQERDFLTEALLGFMLCLLGIYLTLTWIFGSWTRPVVVMAIIPFGLVGTIWGHYIWEVPLSMFSVVGMIGMTGIIINDSIVLITTIDEYAEDRGIIPAVIDAVADRLRPVLLTTLTTVLGLAPLLYEGSQQAQFLKPTVITLVYGLGFGMFLVLLIVPAIVAIQADLGRTTRSWRRMLRAPRAATGPRVALAGASFATVLLLGATVGVFAITGAPWAPLAALGGALGVSTESAAMPVLTLILGLIAIVIVAGAAASAAAGTAPRS